MRRLDEKRILLLLYFTLYFFSISLMSSEGVAKQGIQKKIYENLKLARTIQYDQPGEALRIRKNLLPLAKTLKNKEEMANVYVQLALSYYNLGKYDTASIYCDTVLGIPDVSKQMLAKVSIIRSVCSRRLGDFDRALEYAQQALHKYALLNDTAGMMDVRLSIANIYNETGNNKQAMDYYFKVLEYTQSIHDSIFEGQVLGAIANVYMDIEDFPSASKYLKKAILLWQVHPHRIEYGDALNNFGDFFLQEKKYDSALFYFRKALKIYQKAGHKIAIGVGFQNIGTTQIKLKQYGAGLSNLRKAYTKFEEAKDDYDIVSVSLDLGMAFANMGNVDSARYYLQKTLNVSRELGKTFEMKKAYFQLYELFKKEGDFREALRYYTRFSHFKDSLDNISMKKNFQNLEVKFETAKKEKELQHIKDRQLTAEAQRRFLLVSLILLFVFMGLIISVLVLKRKKDRQINLQKSLLKEQEKMLIENELEHHKALEEQINKELELKTKQLATHAMTMMQKNVLMQELSESIEDLAKKTGDKSPLKQILRKIEKGLDMDKDWDLFRMYFEQIDDSFFHKLKEINPKLTSNDYKLAALIRLNMNIKEMASVLNISANSLKNARYRLKKKLHLPNDLKLPEFIRKL